MRADAESCLNHLRSLLAMAERLSKLNVAIYEHSFSMLAFGSWNLTAGKRKDRVEASWDGKEGVLVLGCAKFRDSRDRPDLTERSESPLGAGGGEKALEEVEDFLTRRFGA
jgi:hypothetical protein